MKIMKLFILVFGCFINTVQAGIPLWTFTPLTQTSVTLPVNGTAIVQYVITNQSTKMHTLLMKPMKGVNQLVGPNQPANVCDNVFVLGTRGASCILTLEIDGSQLQGGLFGGPLVCQYDELKTCYEPAPQDVLRILPEAARYTVGGKISGLIGTVILRNGTETLTFSTDGPFTFPTSFTSGTPYNVTVVSNPITQTCTVNNASGVITNININNINVTCSTNTYLVGGTVSGLSGALVLQNNGTDNLAINANGPFTFSTKIAEGSTYNVTILSSPPNQVCTVNNGVGTIGNSDVTNVTIICSINSGTVGGTISGLTGTIILQNNFTDNLSQSVDGPFTFATPLAEGSTYNVTVLTPPPNETCNILNGSGIMGSSDVTNVQVLCTVNSTTISVTPNGVIPIQSGFVSALTVTNTGTQFAALNVAAVLPSGWGQVQQDASACINLNPSDSCNILFSSPVPYTASSVVVTGDNTSSPPTTALAFTIQGYLVWSVDTASSASVIAPTDDVSSFWGNNLPTGATDTYDGPANTLTIVSTPGIGAGTAASVCYNSTLGLVPAGTWYLPAICQFDGPSQSPPPSANCLQGPPNINDNLVKLGFGGLVDHYWSSTEIDTTQAWLMVIISSTVSGQGEAPKSGVFKVRCARSISY